MCLWAWRRDSTPVRVDAEVSGTEAWRMLSDYGLRLGQLITPAAEGLLRVLAGRWMTARNQKRERYYHRIREQLELF